MRVQQYHPSYEPWWYSSQHDFKPPPQVRERKPRADDSLYDLQGAAERLSVTKQQVRAIIAAGDLKPINVGLGKLKPRYRFAPADIDALIAKRTISIPQESIACPSTATRVRRSINSTSNTVVLDFLERRAARLAKKH